MVGPPAFGLEARHRGRRSTARGAGQGSPEYNRILSFIICLDRVQTLVRAWLNPGRDKPDRLSGFPGYGDR
jgi:hypothetical protein